MKEVDSYRRLSKSASTGRIDGVTAGVMACGVSDIKSKKQEKSAYEGLSLEEVRSYLDI